MILKTKRCRFLFVFLIVVLFSVIDCKRGGGRRGGTYRGSNVWGRAKQSQNAQPNYDLYGSGQRRSKSQAASPEVNKKPDVAQQSAPSSQTGQKSASTNSKTSPGDSSASFIQQEKKQQSAPLHTANAPQNTQQRPIGWDVGQGTKTEGNMNKNVGWNVGNAHQPHTGGNYAYPSAAHVGNQQVYPSHAGAYPNAGASTYYGTGTNYNYGSGNHHSYTPNQYPGYNPSYNTGAYPQQAPNYNHMGGSGYSPAGYNNYGGSFFGGNNYGHRGYSGFGGLGGLGGYGGHGIGGYGKRFGGGFGSGFGKHAFRNVMIGLLVWNLVSGFTRRPYYVYNYYNNPEKIPEEIPLPANAIVLCPENVTELCAPNTAPLCTSNNTILCVVLAQKTVPCNEDSTMKCVNSPVTCAENGDEPCGETNSKNTTSAVNIPCVTNATIIGKVSDGALVPSGGGNSTALCVTTLAVPQPEEEANKEVTPLCNPNIQGGNTNGTTPCVETTPKEITTAANVTAFQNVTNPLAM